MAVFYNVWAKYVCQFSEIYAAYLQREREEEVMQFCKFPIEDRFRKFLEIFLELFSLLIVLLKFFESLGRKATPHCLQWAKAFMV